MLSTEEIESRWSSMEQIRSNYEPVWRDQGKYMAPGMFYDDLSDANQGDRDDELIINESTRFAVRVMTAGMMSGYVSPTRPWMKLRTENEELNNYQPVKVYLEKATKVLHSILRRSNFYDVAPQMFDDLGVFATTFAMIAEDPEDVVRFYHYPIGSYVLNTNRRRRVDTAGWEYRTTLRNAVDQFGVDVLSPGLQKAWATKRHVNQAVDIRCLLMPNPDYKPGNPQARFKKWVIYYWEKGQTVGAGANRHTKPPPNFLRVSGYDTFPAIAPRWMAPGNDVYGKGSPGWISIGTTKAIQELEAMKLLAHELRADPPLNVPRSMAGEPVSLMPGGENYYDDRGGTGKGVFPVHSVNFDTSGVLEDLAIMEQRVGRAFFVDLFLMMDSLSKQGRDPTATEIRALQDEKLLMLGPLSERVNDEFLGPTVDRVWAIAERRGLLPEPPPEILEMDLQVEYVSTMAQAMKLAGIAGVERLTAYVGNVAQFDPSALDKFDVDQAIDEVADMLGSPASIVRSDDDAADIRMRRQAREQAAQQMAMAAQAAETAKTLGTTPIESGTALGDLIRATGAA